MNRGFALRALRALRASVVITLVPLGALSGQPGSPRAVEASRCHVYIDHEFIWTLEMVRDVNRDRVPILNIITLAKGEWDFRPEQIHLHNKQEKEASIKRFSMDTGVPGEPYLTEYFKVLGNSFIGIDLEGKFDGFGEPAQVKIDLGEQRFELQPVDCLEFEMLAEKINNVNFDSPDIKEDYHVLKIGLIGQKTPRPRGRR